MEAVVGMIHSNKDLKRLKRSQNDYEKASNGCQRHDVSKKGRKWLLKESLESSESSAQQMEEESIIFIYDNASIEVKENGQDEESDTDV